MKIKICSIISKMRFLLLIPIFSHSENLILDNQTIVLYGAQTFDIISLQNNSAIYVDSTTSKLILFCDSIFIDSTSGIYADNISLSQNSMGANFTDVGAGGAGAGYANLGGNGGGDVESSGGIISGHLDSLSIGSVGGAGDVQLIADDHFGGKGGGAIMVTSYAAEIFGEISANGGAGNDFFSSGGTRVWDHGGAGGGSGGHIILNVLHLEMYSGSLLSVRGGDGGMPFEGENEGEPVIPGGGGGGSGGYVTISSLASIPSQSLDLMGGLGGDNLSISCHPGQDGLPGSFRYKHLSITSSSHPDPSIYYLNNEPVFRLAATGQISGYFYEISNNPINNVTLAQSQAIPSYEEEPPVSFSTISPTSEANMSSTIINFKWFSTVDPDPNDEIVYRIAYSTNWSDTSTYVYTAEIEDTSMSLLLGNDLQYYWVAQAIDKDGFIVSSNYNTPHTFIIGTLSNEEELIPDEFALHQNFPNPFNPTTNIQYDLPNEEFVNIVIFDVMGRNIRSLINEKKSAGYHRIQWDAKNDFGEPVSAGMYIYIIRAGENRAVKKMVLLK